jgi:phage terminase small subunit
MAGVKGKSGGPRANSGGKRPGAGRPPKEPTLLLLAQASDDPLEFLKSVWKDDTADAKVRVDAAKAALPFVHGRIGEQGKKNAKKDAAAAAATSSRFAPTAPPPRTVQ